MESLRTTLPSPAISAGNGADRRHVWLEQLIDESRRHRALEHPWLERFAAGDLPDPRAALRELARSYHAYSRGFTTYVRSTLDKLEAPAQRERLEENLREEGGQLSATECAALAELGIDTAWIDGVPHRELFRRFCVAVGLTPAELALDEGPGARWRDALSAYLSGAAPEAAVGALGLGTEGIVSRVYAKLLRGLERFPELEPRERVFFDLHCYVDDEHVGDLLEITLELLVDERAYQRTRSGMLIALELRARYWDALLEAALNPQASPIHA